MNDLFNSDTKVVSNEIDYKPNDSAHRLIKMQDK